MTIFNPGRKPWWVGMSFVCKWCGLTGKLVVADDCVTGTWSKGINLKCPNCKQEHMVEQEV